MPGTEGQSIENQPHTSTQLSASSNRGSSFVSGSLMRNNYFFTLRSHSNIDFREEADSEE